MKLLLFCLLLFSHLPIEALVLQSESPNTQEHTQPGGSPSNTLSYSDHVIEGTTHATFGQGTITTQDGSSIEGANQDLNNTQIITLNEGIDVTVDPIFLAEFLSDPVGHIQQTMQDLQNSPAGLQAQLTEIVAVIDSLLPEQREEVLAELASPIANLNFQLTEEELQELEKAKELFAEKYGVDLDSLTASKKYALLEKLISKIKTHQLNVFNSEKFIEETQGKIDSILANSDFVDAGAYITATKNEIYTLLQKAQSIQDQINNATESQSTFSSIPALQTMQNIVWQEINTYEAELNTMNQHINAIDTHEQYIQNEYSYMNNINEAGAIIFSTMTMDEDFQSHVSSSFNQYTSTFEELDTEVNNINSNWDSYSDDNKISILQTLADIQTSALGINDITIEFSPIENSQTGEVSPNAVANYNPNTDTITFNTESWMSFIDSASFAEFAGVTSHEVVHAYQYYLTQNRDSVLSENPGFSDEIDLINAAYALYPTNSNNIAYTVNPLEVTAHEVGDQVEGAFNNIIQNASPATEGAP